jgi:hypothetical protein
MTQQSDEDLIRKVLNWPLPSFGYRRSEQEDAIAALDRQTAALAQSREDVQHWREKTHELMERNETQKYAKRGEARAGGLKDS